MVKFASSRTSGCAEFDAQSSDDRRDSVIQSRGNCGNKASGHAINKRDNDDSPGTKLLNETRLSSRWYVEAGDHSEPDSHKEPDETVERHPDQECGGSADAPDLEMHMA